MAVFGFMAKSGPRISGKPIITGWQNGNMKQALFHSFIVGFLAASPIGPIGMLCMRRTLFQGLISGLVSALGISCAYAFWAYATIHGLAAFSSWIQREQSPLEMGIGLFFVLYGLHAILNHPSTDYPTLKGKGQVTQFFSTFLVVFLNPATFVLFSALFTLFGIAKRPFGLRDSMEIALFVFLGAITFWTGAAYLLERLKDRIKDSTFRNISRVSALGIMAFGITILVYAFMDLY